MKMQLLNYSVHRVRVTCRLSAVLALAAAVTSTAHASTWTGGSGNWSSNGNPGWNGTGVPDAAGAYAEIISQPSGTTTQVTVDGTTRTIGSLVYSGSGNTQKSISITSSLGLIFDGNGSQAVLRNTNTSNVDAGNNRITFSSGSITLASDLLISNEGGSKNASGSITLSSGLTGAVGATTNLTIYNVSNDYNAGRINIAQASTFTGNILIQKGILAVGGSGNVLGPATNLLTLGGTGNGSATLVTNGSSSTIANNITVAAGSGGTMLLGSVESSSTSTATFSGTITLNDNLNITSSKPAGGNVLFSGVISGIGNISKVGSGLATLSGKNTYTGNTTISDGSMKFASGSELRFSLSPDTSNYVDGTGTVDFSGLFRLAMTDSSITSGTWNLVDVNHLNESFGATFGLAFVGGPSFTKEGSLYISTDNQWIFDTITGNLTLVPEAASLGTLALGTMLLMARGRHRAGHI